VTREGQRVVNFGSGGNIGNGNVVRTVDFQRFFYFVLS